MCECRIPLVINDERAVLCNATNDVTFVIMKVLQQHELQIDTTE